MQILIISPLTSPDEPGAARPWQEARFFAESGHKVCVITSNRHYFTDKVIPEAQGKMFHSAWEAGLSIVRVATTAGRRKSTLLRIINYFSFAVMALLAGLRIREVDLIYVRTPPLLVPITGWALARLQRASFILFIGDLLPEEAVALNLVKHPGLICLWEALENFFRKKARLIVTPVPQIKQLLVAKGFSPDVIHVSTNAYDPVEQRQDPLPADTATALEQWQNRFLIMYTGTMGISHALEVAVEAAHIIQQSYPQIHFVFVGQGDKVPYLRKLAGERQLTNISFLPPVPRSCMTTLLRKPQAVMHLVYQGKVHDCYYLPNKFFEYLGAGKPFIYSGDGDMARIIKEARCGLVVPPEDARKFAEAVLYLWQHQDEAQEMGRRGRDFVMQHYDRRKILANLVERLESLQPK